MRILSKVFLVLVLVSGVGALVLDNVAASANSGTAEIGKAVANFTVTNADGKAVSLTDYKGKTVVLEWTNPGCPFVVAHYANGNMPSLQKKYADKGVVWLLVNSTNSTKKDFKSGKELKAQFAEWKAAAADVLLDSDGKVGKAFNAKTTPHMFIIDKEGKLAYAGAIDDDPSTNGGKDAKVNYVSKALDELIAGKAVTETSTKQYGCSVKY
jgi:peroxiredoxin